jgi:hypothetical protein
MVINMPNTFDLQVDSCVNKEVKTFNRKLSKQLKLLNNAHMKVVNYDRDHFTKHGLHTNSKGKEVLTKEIANSVTDILYVRRKPIFMYWKDIQVQDVSNLQVRRDSEVDKLDNSKMMSMKVPIELEVTKDETEQRQQRKQFQSEVQPSSVLSKRIRQPPTNQSEDFLW